MDRKPSSFFTQENIAYKWHSHLVEHSLPFWRQQGFDHKRQLYHERLSWEGQAIALPQLRLMVQARQIATYCRAHIDGFYNDGAEQALKTLSVLERFYYQGDGAPGWVFSLASDNSVASGVRDLYAHAFILFAYGWAYRLTQEAHYRRLARETAEIIRSIFSLPGGGFITMVPARDDQRSQNPHMHLLEAFLVLAEAMQDEFYLVQASGIVALALRHFIDPRSGVLYEFMDKEWHPQKEWGQNRVEPGHLFEWSWLLGEYRRLTGLSVVSPEVIEQVKTRLFQVGRRKGCDSETGFVFDAITEDGTVLEYSTRIWPQTELIRRQSQFLGSMDEEQKHIFWSLNHHFLDHYMPLPLQGGWVDQREADQKPKVDYMPASSLYHIYGAGREIVLL
ncbi:AGE family epimerase/isomerase [Acetobacteraceae bacterium ESL0709]|nr:AGE family epimerase/isomerase [Acetobacteraceae bacterium ESL0697]MDF7678502.1 AGE family epimerase/isomerase [Acetobacteraceae bacterium ESL0709]